MTPATDSTTVSTDHAVSANGAPSLSDRVRGLRLSEQGNAKGSSGGAGWLPWLLCLIMAITWASFGIRAYTTGGLKAILSGGVPSSTEPTANGTGPAGAPKKEKPVFVPAAPDELVLEVKGYIMASRQIQVGPDRVSGKVTKLDIVEGKFFKRGDALAEIDKVDYEADYLQAKANRKALAAQLLEMENGSRPEEKAQAEAQVDEAIFLLDQSLRDLSRVEGLVTRTRPETNRDNGSTTLTKKERSAALLERARTDIVRVKGLRTEGQTVSEKELIQAVSDAGTKTAKLLQATKNWELVLEGPRKEKIEAMRAQLEQAQARENLAKEMLDRCVIRAPVSGLILSKRTEIGNLVNPLAMNVSFNGGICEMADLTDLEVDLEIQERDVRKVFVGQDCVVRADAYPERHYTARVDRIMPVANSSKAIIPIRVKVRVPRKEEGKYLKPQMGVIVTFYNRPAKPDPQEPPDPTIVD